MINDLLQTDDNYILSNRHIRLLDIIFKQNYKQCSPSDFEKLVLNWASTVLSDEREEWEQNRAESAHVLYRLEKKSDANKRAKCRDNKYASFREHFKEVQKNKFLEFRKAGKQLKANYFASWFLANEAQDIDIPYVEANKINKLTQLAQANNREFKKL